MSEWTLILETTVAEASLALGYEGEVVMRADFQSERSQEVDLFEPLEGILAQVGAGEKLSAVVVGTGPGSYNGARVGIAAAQAVGQVHGCAVAGLCSFEGVSDLGEEAWAVGDARRESFFRMRMISGRASSEVELMSAEEFSEMMNGLEVRAFTFEEVERLPEGAGLGVEMVTPSAENLYASWRARTDQERGLLCERAVEAFYLRPPHITRAKTKSKAKKNKF